MSNQQRKPSLKLGTSDEFGTVILLLSNEARVMISLSPTERLEWLLGQSSLSAAHATVVKLLQQYEQFLRTTNAAESDLVALFMDEKKSREYVRSAYEFGDLMFDTLMLIGNNNHFHRLLVV